MKATQYLFMVMCKQNVHKAELLHIRNSSKDYCCCKPESFCNVCGFCFMYTLSDAWMFTYHMFIIKLFIALLLLILQTSMMTSDVCSIFALTLTLLNLMILTIMSFSAVSTTFTVISVTFLPLMLKTWHLSKTICYDVHYT